MTTSQPEPVSNRSDAGVSLIEVLVALLIFGILSTGIVAGMITISRMTDDNRARAVAAGLAAQDVALARTIGDPFALTDTPTTTTTTTVGSRTYTVVRSTKLVSQTGTDVTCSSSSDLFYARVNVRVTWPGQIGRAAPVQDDTVVASQGRVNDSATGSISVSVTGATGAPQQGVAVSILPTSGGAALAGQPSNTDANGCSRATGVAPGTYAVTLTKSGWLDVTQDSTPTKTVLVTAGANQSLSFQYDQAANYTTLYVPGPVAYALTTPLQPTTLDTTFLNSTSGPYTTASATTSVPLHPFAAGYTAIAGTPVSATGATVCAAEDPSAWSATTSGVNRGAGVRASGATGAGQTTAFKVGVVTGIPMGVVLVTKTSGGTVPAGTVMTATSATSPNSSDPGCTTTSTYTFPATAAAGAVALLLPYGSWSVSYAKATSTGVVAGSGMSAPTNVNGGGVQGNVVTLDPRPAS